MWFLIFIAGACVGILIGALCVAAQRGDLYRVTKG
jgi:hypothetical protein